MGHTQQELRNSFLAMTHGTLNSLHLGRLAYFMEAPCSLAQLFNFKNEAKSHLTTRQQISGHATGLNEIWCARPNYYASVTQSLIRFFVEQFVQLLKPFTQGKDRNVSVQ